MDDIDIILLTAENKKLRKENEELKALLKQAVDVVPVVRAEWIEIKEYEHDKLPIVYECSECAYQYHTQKGGKFKHCPGCGAKMKDDTADLGGQYIRDIFTTR